VVYAKNILRPDDSLMVFNDSSTYCVDVIILKFVRKVKKWKKY